MVFANASTGLRMLEADRIVSVLDADDAVDCEGMIRHVDDGRGVKVRLPKTAPWGSHYAMQSSGAPVERLALTHPRCGARDSLRRADDAALDNDSTAVPNSKVSPAITWSNPRQLEDEAG